MALAVSDSPFQTRTLDHHGLVASACKELGLAEKINQRIGSDDPRRIVQPGVSAVAMIINGLGFTNRRLYLTPQFFESKPLDLLFDEEIEAKDLNEKALGKTLDAISTYGETRFFGEIAFEIAEEMGLLGDLVHLDSTSFSLQGNYADQESDTIQVTHGYSKDHRPDLKQVMLSLSVTGNASLPIWMEPQSGNSSDKKSFHETVERVRNFQGQLQQSHDFVWIADSALYTPEKLLKHEQLEWVSRVPETIKSCSDLLAQPDENFAWQSLESGYRLTELSTDYGGIRQRWMLVHSKQAYKRESKTLEKRIQKEEKALEKLCKQATKVTYGCEQDARRAAQAIEKKQKFHRLAVQVLPVEGYACKGRPKATDNKIIKGYQLHLEGIKDLPVIEQLLRRKGRFIIATNKLNQETLTAEQILRSYKQQSRVEKGFRFIKDPWFMVDSFFVKKPSRISALMVIMTLCLMVYNYAEYKVRKALRENEETLPDQKNKPTNRPTLKWIFQLMEGVSVVYMNDDTKIKTLITNMNEVRLKIVRCLGKWAETNYGIS